MLCERCGEKIYKYNTCNYCHRKICNNCTKSSRRLNKTTRLVICKDCWTNLSTRRQYKTAIGFAD
ncbi:MAG: hypothetical protein QXF41_00215 [Candidatus Micrarchaeaceae archaeon]